MKKLTALLTLLAPNTLLASAPIVHARRPPAKASLPLTHVARSSIAPNPALVSEKCGRVRALKEGQTRYTRGNHVIVAAVWSSAKLPRRARAGEHRFACSQSDNLFRIGRKSSPVHEQWRQIRQPIFALPGAFGSFAQRCEAIGWIITQSDFPQLVAVQQLPISNRASHERQWDGVPRGNGEGLMRHRAHAPWARERSDALPKPKPLDDAEPTVIRLVAGKGKDPGTRGALEVQADDGQRFLVAKGVSDALRARGSITGHLYLLRLPLAGLLRMRSHLWITI